jgi:hypothetical protein
MKMETSDVASKATTVSHRAMTTEKYKNEFEHFYEMIDLLSLGIGTLNEDLTRLNSESLQQTQSLETADKVISKIIIVETKI